MKTTPSERATSPMRVTRGPATWLGPFWVGTQAGLILEVRFGTSAPPHHADDTLGRMVARQIFEFLHEGRRAFDLSSDLFDWSAMPPVHGAILRTLYEAIHWGDTVTYGEVAAMAGHPGAARAAGTACRHNPFSLVVPAHRVVAAGGRLGGFLGRPDLKRRLLEREGSGPFKD